MPGIQIQSMFIICRLIPMICFIFHDNVSNVFLYPIKLLRDLAAFTLLVRLFLLATLVSTLFPRKCVSRFFLYWFMHEICDTILHTNFVQFYTLFLYFAHEVIDFEHAQGPFWPRFWADRPNILHTECFFLPTHIFWPRFTHACVWQQPCAKCAKCRAQFNFAHVLATRAYGSSPVQSVQNAG